MRAWMAVFVLVGVIASCSAGAVDRSPGSRIEAGGTSVFFVERNPQASQGPTVLFLHGASFTAEVWIDSGIFDLVGREGHRLVAVDLPGFGQTDSTEQIDASRGEFLGALIEVVDNGSGVVVVSPSMSGSFSLDLIATQGAASMAGFVPVAPVGIESFTDGLSAPVLDLPTMIVWGGDDEVIDLGLGELLSVAFFGSPVQIIDGAGHAAYRDEPERFTELLLQFLADRM